MFIRRLAVFSLATLFGSLSACRPSATLVRPTPAPPRLSIPSPLPATPFPAPIVPEPLSEPQPAQTLNHPWQPTAQARDWTSIVIHHTATDQGSVESIHETHVAKEWLGIGYHFVIGNGNGMSDGEIEPTFRWREQLHGAHAGTDEYNQHGIGIALVGNFDEKPPTAAQLAAIKRLVAVLKTEYAIDSEHVIGHGEVKATACPGKLFPLTEVSEVNVAEFNRRNNPPMVSHSKALASFPAVPSVGPAGAVREPRRSATLADLSGSRLQ